jgi:serine/threonine protein kinase
MTLASGSKLGPYEILSPLGAGGMGEVYRARDTRLGRDVALKILPESFARESDRLRRFEQEARAVAALNHPNILAIHDIGEQDGSPFLVSELLEGESLRAGLDRGALPQRKTIEYGVQIAQGLAAAHEKGIVHRDLKPENIFITKDGRVKILDFGLAKLVQPTGADGSDATLTSAHTAAGVVMGTASYMAPEQVRGHAPDPRTDIFSFGAVLYEMLSGARAFRRDTAAETMTAVLKDDPPELSEAAHRVSPALERIVRRCLEKNAEQRFQSARDLSFALGALSGSEVSAVARAAVPPPPRVPILLPLAAALALVAVAGLTWWIARRPAPTVRMQFALAVPDEMSISHMALSRDGSMLVFVSPEEISAMPMLYVHHIGTSNVTPLPGTQGRVIRSGRPMARTSDFSRMASCRKSRSRVVHRKFWQALWRRAAAVGEARASSSLRRTPKVHCSASMPTAPGWRRSPKAYAQRKTNPIDGPFFFPMATIFCSGRAISRTPKTIA